MVPFILEDRGPAPRGYEVSQRLERSSPFFCSVSTLPHVVVVRRYHTIRRATLVVERTYQRRPLIPVSIYAIDGTNHY